MAKRIITAVIWLPIAALLVAFAPIWGIALAISVLAAIGVYELLWATGLARRKELCVCGCICVCFRHIVCPPAFCFLMRPKLGL